MNDRIGIHYSYFFVHEKSENLSPYRVRYIREEVWIMEWMERMKRALEYLEENLSDEISFEEVARLAMCSSYHFQRMFSFITDVPLAEYIRRRRLTLAVQDLQNPERKVIDIALKYGYDSPDAFSRAFRKLHGMTPSAAREPGVILKAYPKISFYLTLKGDKEVEYKIVEREGFKVFGKSIKTNEVDKHEIRAFLNSCHESGLHEEIRLTAGYGQRKEPGSKQVFQVLYDHKSDGTFNYMIAAEGPQNDKMMIVDFDVLEIPKSIYAVFIDRCPLSQAIGNKAGTIWQRLPEWFESTGYEYADKPALEVPSYTQTEKIIEIWVPINKK